MPAIPTFPAFRSLTLDDKSLLDPLLKLSAVTSELTFTNFFIWRDCDRSLATSINGNICIMANPENESSYFFEPIGRNKMDETIGICLSHAKRMSRVTEAFKEQYLKDRKDVKIEQDRDNADYIYLQKDLAELKGKKFDGKRNRIKKFLRTHLSVYREITKNDIAGCLELLERWKESRKGVCFDIPIKEALLNMEVLGLKGALIEVAGRVEAFTIGEKLSPDTAIVYIEVTEPAMEGLPQHINQQFSLNAWSGITYINREQDLGDAGLRRAKLSYHPVKILDKYNITI